MRTWMLQDAKARFSELVNICLKDGPQLVTRHGREAVVIIPVEDYKKVTAPDNTLKEFFLKAPRVELDLHRSFEVGREIDL